MEETSSSDIHEKVLVSLRRIIRAVDLYSRKLVRNHQLTGPQLAVLKELYSNGSSTITTLANKIHLSNATVTGILDRLENRDLIKRVRDSRDRRKVYIHLTDASDSLLKQAPSLLQEEFLEAFGRLPFKEQLQILESLEKIASLLGAESLDAAPILLVHPIPIHERKLHERAIEDSDTPDKQTGEIDGT